MGDVVTNSPSKVVALVLNWRLAQPTLQVLADLEQSGHPTLQVVAIDNGSGDGSAAAIESWIAQRSGSNGPRFELLAFDQNLGYCAAMNRGIERAAALGCDYVLFLNNDVRLPADFLAPLVAVLDNDPSLACVGPTVLEPDGRVWCEGGGVRFRPNLVVLHRQGQPAGAKDRGPEAVEFMPGACALFRREDLEAVDRLDESYLMYWEDVDLGERLRARGRKILWLPWVEVTHEPSGSSGGGRSPLRKYLSAANSVRFLRRHGSVRLWSAFWLLDCLAWPLTFLGKTGAAATLAKGRGLWDGFRSRPQSSASVARYLPTKKSP